MKYFNIKYIKDLRSLIDYNRGMGHTSYMQSLMHLMPFTLVCKTTTIAKEFQKSHDKGYFPYMEDDDSFRQSPLFTGVTSCVKDTRGLKQPLLLDNRVVLSILEDYIALDAIHKQDSIIAKDHECNLLSLLKNTQAKLNTYSTANILRRILYVFTGEIPVKKVVKHG